MAQQQLCKGLRMRNSVHVYYATKAADQLRICLIFFFSKEFVIKLII